MEGWAQANQGTPAEELARAAWDDREKGRSLTLRATGRPGLVLVFGAGGL